MKKKLIGIIVCTLLIVPLIALNSVGEENTTINNHKYIVYFSGNNVTSWEGHDYPFRGPNRCFNLFLSGEDNYVKFNLLNSTIFLIVNGKSRTIEGSASVYFGLSAHNTFLVLWIPPLRSYLHPFDTRYKIFGICDNLEIFEG